MKQERNSYYGTGDYQPIDVIDRLHMDFNLGNAVKYILRSGKKHEEGYQDIDKAIEDLKKAVWYINDEIQMLDKQKIIEL